MKLNQVTLPSLDVPGSIEFYKTLGLELIVYTGSHYARFVCPQDQTTLSLHQVEELPVGQGVIIYFEVEDLDFTVERFISQGIEFTEMPVDRPWLWREAVLYDPNGNKIILYYGGENRLNPPWKYEG